MRGRRRIAALASALAVSLGGWAVAWGDQSGEIAARVSAEPVRVLLLSGANNHDWKSTTPRLERILEDSGRFAVTVLEQTHTMTAELLADFDVILSDFNTFVGRTKPPRDPGWTDAAREAYIQFVRAGKGHVVVHAGSSSFYDWPDYQELVISSFKIGQTDHGLRHTFPVRIDVSDHPITQGMRPFHTFDELWDHAPVQDDATVLASAFSSTQSRGSGRWEPIAMVRQFGEGRSFTLMLGHDTKAMENSSFQALLLRGAEWAATGDVSIPAPSSTLHWLESEDEIALADASGIVWRFDYSDESGKPHFHPLALPGGAALTWKEPADHPWHYGLWFSWKFINGVNYWEEDRATGQADGRTEWSNVRITTRPDHSARIEMDLAYRPREGKPVMTEQRVIDVSTPADDGSYHLDWSVAFTALEDVQLDRTPLPDEPGGKVYGGYAGLSMRFASAFGQRQVVSSDGPVTYENDRYRGRARAVDYSGAIDGAAMGMAIMDDAANLNAPSPWYVIKSDVMTYFSPAVICYGPHELAAGQSMTLRYRVTVHPQRWDQSRLTAAHEAFNALRQGNENAEEQGDE